MDERSTTDYPATGNQVDLPPKGKFAYDRTKFNV